jgi:hypothetical protein
MIFNNDNGTTSVSIYNVSDGSGIPVSISNNAQTYLDGALKPLTDLRALTVADYTFVADTTQEIAMTSDLSPELPHEALVFVKLGDYSKEYSIEIDGEKYIYKSGDGQNSASDTTANSEGSGRDADTEYIASQLALTLGTGGRVTSINITNGGSGYTSPPTVNFSNPSTGADNAY